jgi:hypothetical protein
MAMDQAQKKGFWGQIFRSKSLAKRPDKQASFLSLALEAE